MGPEDLAQVLGQLEPNGKTAEVEVLVSSETGDDAAVVRLPGGGCLVQSVDFFTPIVDDAFTWGRIAAANALSDIYAMGARPAFALNVAAWPANDLPMDLLAQVFRGGAEVAGAAGAAVLGGHTIDDREPKYGMAVTGFAEEKALVFNSTAEPGAALVLTKPLGIGILTTAIKRETATPQDVELVVSVMTRLNASASEAMVEAGVLAATDVTGFGLLGHLRAMAHASGVAAEIDAAAVPLMPRVSELAAEGVVPGGTKRNHRFLRAWVDWGELDEPGQLVLADAQTSGGLLIAVAGSGVTGLLAGLEARGVEGTVVGRTTDGQPGRIEVRGRL